MTMSLPLLTLSSPTPSSLHLPYKPSSSNTPRLFIPSSVTPFRSSPNKLQFLNHTIIGNKRLGFSLGRNSWIPLIKAKNGEGEEREMVVDDEAEKEARGQSTMPERFRHLTQEVPEPPLRWPYFIAVPFLIYAWKTVLWELHNWKQAVKVIFHFLGYLAKLVLALIFHFIGDPITSTIRGIETALYSVRAFYSWVVACAPVPELTVIIMLASTVLAIAEATVPDSVSSQPYLLSVAGLTGFAAVRGLISEPFFWTLLMGMFGFARFIMKRDYVSSALPVAAVLAAVGEPWVRIVVMASYLALAIIHHSNKPLEDLKEVETPATGRRIPIPLLCTALAIGVRVAAKWAGYRHLTWMIV